MATFKDNEFVSSADLLRRQKGKPIIYLEGNSDKHIFENFWFVELLEKVTFAIVPETQGCTAVVNKVGADRNRGVAAFGLVDRDKLMADNNWPLLREVDDSAFEAARPYKEVKVTRRWELESYLLDPPIFETYVSVADGGRAPRKIDEVEAEFLRHAEALVPLAALNQTLHLHRARAAGDGFTKLDDRATVDARIRAEKFSAHPQLEADYDAALPTIDAFGGLPALPPGEKLEGLLRILNGKAMLDRVSRASKLNHDLTYFLARDIKQAGRVPAELREFVEQCFS